MSRTRKGGSSTPDPFDPLDGPFTAEVDLHLLTSSEARVRLAAFLKDARQQHPGALVHIITGRGRNSPSGPVLKSVVRSLLRSGSLPQVAAYGQAFHEGGFLVRLKGGRC